MNIATINLDNICRSCLSEEDQLTSIFNTMNTNDIRVVEMFRTCSFLLVYIIIYQKKLHGYYTYNIAARRTRRITK